MCLTARTTRESVTMQACDW